MNHTPHADGTKPEYSAWLQEHHPALFRAAVFHARGDRQTAIDVVQIAAVKIGRSWDNDEIREKIIASEAYVHTIVKNCLSTYLKIRSRIEGRERELDPDRHHVIDDGPDLELRAAILSLPQMERSMILLHYYMGYTIIAAGAKLDLSRDQSHRLHSKAIKRLKALITDTE
ncbi:RNA polymerase sigma factor [Nonomuraea sp. NPDC059007]|uniref:RNA polymerase sigma factor n=1 Tax=Nonomuraea sp. NPDC059007 TaxID=3346692 RepID=UPI0036CC8D28